MTARLSNSVLDNLPADIARPDYDRNQVKAGVLHLGVGAFHRGHQAAYFDRLLAEGDMAWGIRGASLRSARVAEQLNPQDGLFTLLEREGEQHSARIVGSLLDVIVASRDPGGLIGAIAKPDVQVITMTITEKGYCLDPASGALQLGNADVVRDLSKEGMPATAPGFLLAGLNARKQAGLGGLTILSCDNIPENGARTRDAVLGFAEAIDPGLVSWIEDNVAFPSSMVDRIVPATVDEDVEWLEARLGGIRDEAMVKTEPFTQWVVEDHFTGARPALETVGVQMTGNVAPWEIAKLRMLNGAHSAIAYLGGLAGCEYVHAAMIRPEWVQFINKLWDESQATLQPIPGFDIAAYRRSLMARFQNSALMHRTHQIAMDGSQKLPQRLLSPLKSLRQAGHRAPSIILAIAGWMRWQSGRDETGASIYVQDPFAQETARIAGEFADRPGDLVSTLLSIGQIFEPWVREDEQTVDQLVEAYRRICEMGVIEAIKCTD